MKEANDANTRFGTARLARFKLVCECTLEAVLVAWRCGSLRNRFVVPDYEVLSGGRRSMVDSATSECLVC